MKTLVLLISITVLLALTPEMSYSQDMAPKKMENPEWKRVVHVDYKAGKDSRALEIIDEYFRKAAVKAGTPQPQAAIRMNTGKYDLVLIWAMSGGVDDMNWEVSPNNAKWRTALNEVAGGADKAQEILDEYSSLIASSSSEVGFQRK